jgi:aspartate/methionine/tyrosine aminotransferase
LDGSFAPGTPVASVGVAGPETSGKPGALPSSIGLGTLERSGALAKPAISFFPPTTGNGALAGKLFAFGNIYYVCTPTPLQAALARVLLADPGYYARLRTDFRRKRAILAGALERAGFQVYPSRSAFYIWTRIPERFADAAELNEFLIRTAGVAGVPGSAFMDNPERDVYMRLCFAREDAMLIEAAERLERALR